MSKEIYIELEKKEKNVLQNLINDYNELLELIKFVMRKDSKCIGVKQPDIAVIDYIKNIISILSKLVKTNSINIEDGKDLEQYYIANSEILETNKYSSEYELFENSVLKKIIDKIHTEVE